MKTLLKLFFMFPAFVLMQCSDNDAVRQDTQAVYFQIDILSHSWNHQHNGLFVDRDGNILRYTNPDRWVSLDSVSGYMPESAMKANLQQASRASQTPDMAAFRQYAAAISAIGIDQYTKVVISETETVSRKYYAFKFDEENRNYQSILIFESDGNTGRLNSDPSAAEIYKWLKELGK